MGLLTWLKQSLSSPREDDRTSSNPSDEEIDLFNPFPDPITLPLSDVIDLHTIPPRDVKRVVEEYLLQAKEAGYPVVRIIHGKGIGVQREIVRSKLKETSFVIDWTDAPPEAGGLGATIVRLQSTDYRE